MPDDEAPIKDQFMKLNLACGSEIIEDEEWVNVDYALGARLMKVPLFRVFNRKVKIFNLDWNDRIFLHDLTKKFPWGDESIDVIYSSHTLEHLNKKDGRTFLTECHRVLRKNGIIRVVVPDLRHIVLEYIEGRISADNFVADLGVLYGIGNSAIKKRLSPFFSFPHKCMYDNERLIEILKEIGFDASPRYALDSAIGEIRLIELESRTENAVIVEGRKVV